MFEFTIKADSWDDLEMKVRNLFPAETVVTESTIKEMIGITDLMRGHPPVDNEHVAKGALPFTATEIALNNPKKAKGWPKGKKRGKKVKIEKAVLDKAYAAEKPKPDYAKYDAAPVIEQTRTFDNPIDAYKAAIKAWQTRSPWSLMDGTVISDRGPVVGDFR